VGGGDFEARPVVGAGEDNPPCGGVRQGLEPAVDQAEQAGVEVGAALDSSLFLPLSLLWLLGVLVCLLVSADFTTAIAFHTRIDTFHTITFDATFHATFHATHPAQVGRKMPQCDDPDPCEGPGPQGDSGAEQVD
jgi:hypothetical protein